MPNTTPGTPPGASATGGHDEPVRTGEEAQLQQELKTVDQQGGRPIADDPQGAREERRRSKFIDLHGDEDLDPNTSEANNG
jgi:hypothetical protein